MKSYKQNFQDNLNAEIIGFREKIMAQPAQEIYDDVYRIHFYEFMYDYLGSEKFSTAEYKAFLEADKTFIDNLWRQSLDWEDFNVGNLIDASLLVDAYMRDYAAHPVPDCM